MKKIFVIQASKGFYEDSVFWSVKAFTDKSAAEAYSEKANRIIDLVVPFYRERLDQEHINLDALTDEEYEAGGHHEKWNHYFEKTQEFESLTFRIEEIELVQTEDKVMLIGGKKPLHSITEEDAITALIAYHSEKNRYRLSRELLMGVNKSSYLKDERVRKVLEQLNYLI